MIAKSIHSLDSGLRPFIGGRGRSHLPWRKTHDPYKILVSEVMLQQTQVDRVVPYYKKFLKEFPTPSSLASSSLARVLRAWQGLGYNRRAKYLHEAAKQWGTVPLEDLPGVGPYTAKAVRVFAFNEPEIMIETNIRSVFIHHFFPKKKKVSDAELLPLVEKTLPRKRAREWFSALMDYGAHLKATHPNPSRRSKHHTRQKPFKGSDREIRGAVVRASLAGDDISKLPFDERRVRVVVAALRREGLVSISSPRSRGRLEFRAR